MWEKKAKFSITILILLSCSVIGVSMLSSKVAADTIFSTTMPVIYVDPQNITASKGDTFTISVKIFNLTAIYYETFEEWQPGEELGPKASGGQYNYSLGRLYGFDIKFSWDPTLLDYVSHSVKIPEESNPGGVLHEPIIDLRDEVYENGTYWLAKSSQSPAEPFNCPDSNATLFTMTFNVTKNGLCSLSLASVELATLWHPLEPHKKMIPHLVRNAQFQTLVVATRIVSVKVGALIGTQMFDPLILGENPTVQITVKNDNLTITDTYNLTLYYDNIPLENAVWTNRNLSPNETETLNYTMATSSLERGVHTIKASAKILHGVELIIDEISKQFRVIDTPNLVIDGPTSASGGQTVTFDASQSAHNDPDGTILNYTWRVWAPGETLPKATYSGVTMQYTFPQSVKVGTWRIELIVKDSFGVTYDDELVAQRPRIAAYQKEVSLEVGESGAQGFFNLENIAFIVILVGIIAIAIFYLYRRTR